MLLYSSPLSTAWDLLLVLCKFLVMEKMEIGVNSTCIVPSGGWARVLWLFWGCSLPGARVVTYRVLMELCVLGPALWGGHRSPKDEGGFLLVSLKKI